MTKYEVVGIIPNPIADDLYSWIIAYKCPTCGQQRETLWVFPEAQMIYRDSCHGKVVVFEK